MPRISRRGFLKLALYGGILYTVMGSVKAYTLSVDEVDAGLGTRLLFAPDIHTHGGDRGYLVDAVASLKPDILVLGGDLWDYRTPSLSHVKNLINGIRGYTPTIIMVLGNHEYIANARGRVRLGEAIQALEDLGVTVLRDDKTSIGGLIIGGLDWRHNPKHYTDPARRLGEVDVMISHSPDSFPHLSSKQHILLAGHTHGGQVCLPGQVSMATNSVYGYTWGTYRMGDRVMYLSRGAGEMVPPRVYCGRHVYLLS
ncbi:MAG: metallophosphoesterase [Desulfurococcales archaeon]|nr:metallophosphoesterase [Desulfurococcales archaeon]